MSQIASIRAPSLFWRHPILGMGIALLIGIIGVELGGLLWSNTGRVWGGMVFMSLPLSLSLVSNRVSLSSTHVWTRWLGVEQKVDLKDVVEVRFGTSAGVRQFRSLELRRGSADSVLVHLSVKGSDPFKESESEVFARKVAEQWDLLRNRKQSGLSENGPKPG